MTLNKFAAGVIGFWVCFMLTGLVLGGISLWMHSGKYIEPWIAAFLVLLGTSILLAGRMFH